MLGWGLGFAVADRIPLLHMQLCPLPLPWEALHHGHAQGDKALSSSSEACLYFQSLGLMRYFDTLILKDTFFLKVSLINISSALPEGPLMQAKDKDKMKMKRKKN